jgi:enediyne biosynthesis protein E4
VSTGRYDASIGTYLQGDGSGNFQIITAKQSGFVVDKDAKGLSKIIIGDNEVILAGVNNERINMHFFDLSAKHIRADKDDTYALVRLKNGKIAKHEFYYGSTYLSNSSRSIQLNDSIKEIERYGFSGQKNLTR